MYLTIWKDMPLVPRTFLTAFIFFFLPCSLLSAFSLHSFSPFCYSCFRSVHRTYFASPVHVLQELEREAISTNKAVTLSTTAFSKKEPRTPRTPGVGMSMQFPPSTARSIMIRILTICIHFLLNDQCLNVFVCGWLIG